MTQGLTAISSAQFAIRGCKSAIMNASLATFSTPEGKTSDCCCAFHFSSDHRSIDFAQLWTKVKKFLQNSSPDSVTINDGFVNISIPMIRFLISELKIRYWKLICLYEWKCDERCNKSSIRIINFEYIRSRRDPTQSGVISSILDKLHA